MKVSKIYQHFVSVEYSSENLNTNVEEAAIEQDTRKEYSLDKNETSYDDSLDALRLALRLALRGYRIEVRD